MGVEIKGQKDGFTIVVDEDLPFVEAREKLVQKFEESGNFFKGAKFFKFIAPGLKNADIRYLKELVVESYDLVFIDEEEDQEKIEKPVTLKPKVKEKAETSRDIVKEEDVSLSVQKLKEKLSSFDETIGKILKITNSESVEAPKEENKEDNNLKTKFVFENMRSGSELEYDGNIIIFGDVNPGAKIIARGNIIVMGSFRGMAHAGKKSDEPCFIAALKLLPLQIRIQDVFAVPPQDAKIIENAMVTVKSGEIEIEQF